jgi:hypothetical protein
MNWNNIDLNRPSERQANILDGLTFDILLLEISCNLTKINKETIRAQFELDLKIKIDSAREVFEANSDNILKDAIKYRDMA